MSTAQNPPLVLIVADFELTGNSNSQALVGRNIHQVPILGVDLPFASLATTIATGVHAMTHGIVTFAEVDSETLTLRPVNATDRLFPAIWSYGVSTCLIGWPGARNDELVVSEVSQAHLHENTEAVDAMVRAAENVDALTSIMSVLPPIEVIQYRLQLATIHQAAIQLESSDSPELIGIALKSLETPNEVLEQHVQSEFKSFLQRIPSESNVVIVQNCTQSEKMPEHYTASYYITSNGGSQPIYPPAELPRVGGSLYRLFGRECPYGVSNADWDFLPPLNKTAERLFPLSPKQDGRDWDAIIESLLKKQIEDEKSVSKTINLIVRRFVVLTNLALRYDRWDRIEEYSRHLIALRGATRDYWMKVLCLFRQGKNDGLSEESHELIQRFPSIPVSILAECMLLHSEDEQLKTKLLSLDLSEMKIPSSVGIYGVLLIRAGCIEEGMEALCKAQAIGALYSSERAVLAEQYYQLEQFERAIQTLGSIGHQGGKFVWRLLRLKILVALQETELAGALSRSILEAYPDNEHVKQIMGKG